MSKEIPPFKRLSPHVQSISECNAVDVIYESFVVPGDQDFLMSRLLAQKGLHRGFYWAAAQATEKYLKAFLLLNGSSVLKFSNHPIKKLHEAAEKIEPDFSTLDVHPHPRIQVEESAAHHLKKFTISGFLEELETHGSADNRYNTYGVEYNTGHLFAMDSLSFKVRNKIGAPPIFESFKKLSPDLLATFENFNPWFQHNPTQLLNEIPNKEFPIQCVSSVTKFEFLTRNKCNPACDLALQWLRKMMKLPTAKQVRQ